MHFRLKHLFHRPFKVSHVVLRYVTSEMGTKGVQITRKSKISLNYRSSSSVEQLWLSG